LDVLDALAEGWRRGAAFVGEDNREKQGQAVSYGRPQRIINLRNRERRNDHEEDRSQKRRKIRKESWQDLVGPHVHPV
jgi:hypothetical protein